jgi:hypothetical protein
LKPAGESAFGILTKRRLSMLLSGLGSIMLGHSEES